MVVVTLARAEASLAGMEVRVAPRCPARHLPLAEVPVGGGAGARWNTRTARVERGTARRPGRYPRASWTVGAY